MHIAILGNGISGVTAARFIRKLSDHKITIISGETAYPFSRTALMYIYMGHLRLKDTELYAPHFYKENQIDLVQGWVEKIDFDKKQLLFSKNSQQSSISYDQLILATGSKPNRFGWPGQDLKGVHGMYSLQDLQKMEDYSNGLERAVIVGGGLIGVEMAEMFHSRSIPVSFLVREDSFWDAVLPPEESEMVNEEIREHGIDLQLSTELKKILADDSGRCRAVCNSKDEEIDCGFVGLTAGVHPNIEFLKDSGLKMEKGIVVDEYLRTNKKDVYAIGDCAQLSSPPIGRRPIEAVWYVGKIMGETLAYTICEEPTRYAPGHWFNSAKFFNIEYQVYGEVPVSYDDELSALFYRKGKQSLRIVYQSEAKEVVGFHSMGVRLRHEMCEAWIEQKTPLRSVLENLTAAYFDPELHTNFHRAFIEDYNREHSPTIQLRRKPGLHNFWTTLGELVKSN
jgi:NAD(P)H-nitrite reductase large subunit